jgi:phage shock protein B
LRFLGRLFLLAMLAVLVLAGLLTAAGAGFWIVFTAFPGMGHEVGLYHQGTFVFSRFGWIPGVSLVLGPIVLLGILFCIVLVIRALSAIGRSKEPDRQTGEESRLMQELHRGLARLEDRVEALETLLLDRTGPGAQTVNRRRSEE